MIKSYGSRWARERNGQLEGAPEPKTHQNVSNGHCAVIFVDMEEEAKLESLQAVLLTENAEDSIVQEWRGSGQPERKV